MSRRVLVVRLDSAGDVLLTSPAVRAIAARAEVAFLAGPLGTEAARLLPGVGQVLTWNCPWVVRDPDPVTASDVLDVAALVRSSEVDEALIFTSFHQSPLPTALVLRMAGVAQIGATSVDYPGALLDLRHRPEPGGHEVDRNLALAAAAGFAWPDADPPRLAVRQPLPDVLARTGPGRYVVVHPGASAPARTWTPRSWRRAVRALADNGFRVVVTGSAGERALCQEVAAHAARDLSGRTTLAETAAVLQGADAVVVGNTGPAHLAAAVGTPVVSLFAPTVPAESWAPYGVRSVLLGDQQAACRGSRAVRCPEPGHPCLESVSADDVVACVEKLVGGLSCVS